MLTRNVRFVGSDPDSCVVVIKTPEGRVIEVELLDANPRKARLGVTADKDVVVMRKELLRTPEA